MVTIEQTSQTYPKQSKPSKPGKTVRIDKAQNGYLVCTDPYIAQATPDKILIAPDLAAVFELVKGIFNS